MILGLAIFFGYLLGGYLTLLCWRFLNRDDFVESTENHPAIILFVFALWPLVAGCYILIKAFDLFWLLIELSHKYIWLKINFKTLFFMTDIKKKKEDSVSDKV